MNHFTPNNYQDISRSEDRNIKRCRKSKLLWCNNIELRTECNDLSLLKKTYLA